VFFILSFPFAYLFDNLAIHGDFSPETFYSKLIPQNNSLKVNFSKINGISDYLLKVKFEYVDSEIKSIRFNGFTVAGIETKVRGVISTSLAFLPGKKMRVDNTLEIVLRGGEPESVDIWITNFRKNLQDDLYILKVGEEVDNLSLLSFSGWISWFISLSLLWWFTNYFFIRYCFLKRRKVVLLFFISLGLFLLALSLMHLSRYFSGYSIKISFPYLTFIFLVAFLPVLFATGYKAISKTWIDMFLFIHNFLGSEPTLPGKILRLLLLIFNYFSEILTAVFITLIFAAGVFLLLRVKEAASFLADFAYFIILAAVIIKLLKVLLKGYK
jgi:hypothetical protein